MKDNELDICFWTGYYGDDYEFDYFNWASNKAYLDMNRTMTFRGVGNTDAEKREIEKKRRAWRDEVTAEIRAAFREIDKYKSFREWHKDLCDCMIEMYKKVDCTGKSKLVKKNGNKRTDEDGKLTYGQAQKWLNMTLKYLWLLDRQGMLNEEDHATIEKYKKEYDIPLDSYILKYAAWLERDKKFPENTGLNKSVIFEQLGGSDWSHIDDYEKYAEYQDELKKQINKEYDIPLIWELKHWHNAIIFYGEKTEKKKQQI